MRRRYYFLLPDVKSARALLDQLLLARIEERYIHFIAKPDTLPPDMPEANLFQRTDLIHGTEAGIFIGTISGLLACALMLMMPLAKFETQLICFALCGTGGAFLGAWMASRAASAIPNSHLGQYLSAINQGQVLLLLDVPAARSGELKALIHRHCPPENYPAAERPMTRSPA